ncbi:hypothetical protein [Rhizobacter sp. Root1221]|uniref:hypothetical protein n=1 Tax=Rhizobacter sp. Root1221 TaxID=1736433 RepID=UPI0006FD2381|nr:hypothetical protein [Rhizobacter sp. Root1221]KQV94760.1 hypothetical protein ASC87_25970 [Rhizobacter sp. Root1221]
MKTTFGRRIACGIALAAALQAPAHAWDKSSHGTIAVTEVTAGQNFGYRVWLDGEPALCSNGLGWAYLLETDSNYKTFVAALLMAKAMRNPVTVHTSLQNGYCHIEHIAF